MEMKRTLTALLAVTMACSLAACGETGSTADPGTAAESAASESSTAGESSEESAEAESSTAEESAEESSEAAESGDDQMESFSSEHTPFGIKFDYALPKLSKYDLKPDDARNPDYFNYGVTYHYNYQTDDETLSGIRADVYAGI